MTLVPALFGKCPGHGDFIAQNMLPDFEPVWLDWMNRGLAAHVRGRRDSEKQFLNGATWAFAARSSAFGCIPFAGVLVPSKDSAGRLFPLALLAFGDEETDILATAPSNMAWYRAMRQQLFSQIEMTRPVSLPDAPWRWESDAAYAQVLGLEGSDPRLAMLLALLEHALEEVRSIWWTLDDDDPPQSVVIQTGPGDDDLWQRLFLNCAAHVHPEGCRHAAV